MVIKVNKNIIQKETNEKFYYYDSPIGLLEICGTEKHIKSVFFRESEIHNVERSSELLENCTQQLREYFNKERKEFDLPLAPEGTIFQKAVWHALLEVPFGVTASYFDIAKKLDNPKAVRAVGGANGKNPISIIIPCHRIIGSSGKLIGYGGGLWRKKWLLQHEQNLLL
ncbi:methylated-DNA--[protein]-cysteine S-methyltransferase [candidate division KSB1 bacterium]|nr:methylated-DNA--[protein]-cysteine S-methyltransferase [candidate division KSB1 bacterium]MBL7094552.1 methylated-DNA--[protein]-cysteine S-methyltransferase [candidate division KSB1 bacterium]